MRFVSKLIVKLTINESLSHIALHADKNSATQFNLFIKVCAQTQTIYSSAMVSHHESHFKHFSDSSGISKATSSRALSLSLSLSPSWPLGDVYSCEDPEADRWSGSPSPLKNHKNRVS